MELNSNRSSLFLSIPNAEIVITSSWSCWWTLWSFL